MTDSPSSKFDGAIIAHPAVGAGVTGIVSASDSDTEAMRSCESASPFDSHTGATLFSAGLRDSAVVIRPDVTSWVASVAFSPDGKLIAAGLYDNTVRVWDSESGQEVVGPLESHTYWVSSVMFSPDGKRIVSGSGDNTVRVWDPKSGKAVAGPFNGHTGAVSSVVFSPDGKRVASGSYDNTVRVWDSESGKQVSGPFDGHTAAVSSVAFSPSGKWIVSGSYDTTVCVWDSESGEKVSGPFDGHTTIVSSVAFSSDGKRIVSGSYDHTVCVWDSDSGEKVSGPFNGHTDAVSSVAFSPDGKRIVSGSYDTTVRVWVSESGKEATGAFNAHTGTVSSVAFSPDGKRIVSGSYDTTVRVWDSGKVDGPVDGHTHWVSSVVLSPERRLRTDSQDSILARSDDKTILVWDEETRKDVDETFRGIPPVAESGEDTEVVARSNSPNPHRSLAQFQPWETYEPTEFEIPWLLFADLLHGHGLSLGRTKYYDDLSHNTNLLRRAAVEPFYPRNDEDFVHRLDGDWNPSVKVRDRAITFFQENVFINLALDQYLRHVIVKVIMAGSIELQILKHLSSDPLRSDPRNHTIPVLQFIPCNGFEFSVQACWYEHWQSPPFDCARSRFEMARQLLEGLVFMHEQFIAHGDIHPRNILWNHAPTFYEPSRHSKFSFRMAYIDFGGGMIFSAENRHSRGSGVRPPSAWAAPELSLSQPYDLCAADVCMLGKVLQGEMEDGQKYYNIPPDVEVYERYHILLVEMTSAKPEERPTASAALALLYSLISALNDDV
ncbi:WD40-repeat-containing domain protein [Mycena rebaudengoi]|nr:WD40-repeat-containing domain protein [Mycena rebaudengoi]